MTEYIKYGVSLGESQKSKLARALVNKSAITIRLSTGDLNGPDELFLTRTQIKKIEKARSQNKGVDLKISKTQLKRVVKRGGSLFSSLMALGTKLLPLATKALPGIATGALSALTDFGVSKALGGNQKGGFLIPKNKINKLKAHKSLLTKKQKEALKSGGQLVIKPTPKQRGGFLGTLLASIGIPILMKALTGKGMQNRGYKIPRALRIPPPTPKNSGNGLQNRPYSDQFLPYQTPPFWGDPTLGRGMKKSKK